MRNRSLALLALLAAVIAVPACTCGGNLDNLQPQNGTDPTNAAASGSGVASPSDTATGSGVTGDASAASAANPLATSQGGIVAPATVDTSATSATGNANAPSGVVRAVPVTDGGMADLVDARGITPKTKLDGGAGTKSAGTSAANPAATALPPIASTSSANVPPLQPTATAHVPKGAPQMK